MRSVEGRITPGGEARYEGVLPGRARRFAPSAALYDRNRRSASRRNRCSGSPEHPEALPCPSSSPLAQPLLGRHGQRLQALDVHQALETLEPTALGLSVGIQEGVEANAAQ